MSQLLEEYIRRLRLSLKLDSRTKRDIVRELESHLEDREQELVKRGLSGEEAAREAAHRFGPAEEIARRIYLIHCQGTWKHAGIAALPHVVFGLLFALHWWQNAAWVALALVTTMGLAFYGWRKGRPVWLFPWMGYSLLPVICAGLLLLLLPRGWSWLAILLYVPLALRVTMTIVLQAAKTDWLYSTLMLLPLPLSAAWLMAMEQSIRNWDMDKEKLLQISPWIGLSFLGLAVTVISFMRLRGRWLKIGALFTPEIIIVMLVALYAREEQSLLLVLTTLVFTLLILCTPLYLEQRYKREEAATTKG